MFTLIRINLNHRNHMIIATSTFPKRSVFKMFCTLRATFLGEAGTEGGGGGDNTLHFSPLRATSPKRACSKCFASILNRKVDIFKWFIHFQDGVFEKITRIRWNTPLKLAKRCLLSLNVISGLIRSPPPSPAVYNLLLTREEGTIYSWNHRCERDWCLQIAIRKDWFQIERIPGQRETGLCTYGTQAPTGYHCLLLWL